MTSIKRQPFLLLIFTIFFFVSCQTYYRPVSLAHEAFFSLKERPIRRPELLFLGDYNVWVLLNKNDDEKNCYARLDIGNGKQNQKILNLKVTMRDLSSFESRYELQTISLVQGKYREINPPLAQSNLPTTSPLNLNLNSDDSYDLTYIFHLKSGRKPSGKVCVRIEANYESNGEIKFFKDSVVFQKDIGFTLN